MSAFDPARLPRPSRPLPGEMETDTMGEISANSASRPIRPTRIVPLATADGGYAFAGDVEMTCTEKPSPYPHDPDRGEWTLTVRTSDRTVKGHALVLALHPFSEDWIDAGDGDDWHDESSLKRPLNSSHDERMRRFAATAEAEEGWKQSLAALPFDPFETDGACLRAVLRAPKRGAPNVESGRAYYSGEDRPTGRIKEPTQYWGLCPFDKKHGLESVIQSVVDSGYLQALLGLLKGREIDFGWAKGKARSPDKIAPRDAIAYDKTLEVAGEILRTAARKALAGPRDSRVGPRNGTWDGVPVAVHAGSLFLEAVNRYNRQIWRGVKKTAKNGGAASRVAAEAVSPQEGIDLVENASMLAQLLFGEEDHEHRVGVQVAMALTSPGTWRHLDSAIRSTWLDGLERVAKFGSISIAAEAKDLLRPLRDSGEKAGA